VNTLNPDIPLIRQRNLIVPSSGCLVIFNISNFTKAYFKWPIKRSIEIVDIKYSKPLKTGNIQRIINCTAIFFSLFTYTLFVPLMLFSNTNLG